jgi:hypothetical protein
MKKKKKVYTLKPGDREAIWRDAGREYKKLLKKAK